MIKPALSKHSTEVQIGKVLDRIRNGELSRNLLVDLLSERHAIYKERPSYQMNRIKGYALASFKEAGLPSSAINFLLDELQNGRNAYMVGGAARGLRGAKNPKVQYVSFLIQAVNNLRYHDDSFDLTVFKPKWPLKRPSNARLEIFKTLQWLKGYAKAAIPELKSFLKNTRDFSPDLHEEIRKTIEIIEKDERDLDISCCEIEGKSNTGISWLWKGMRNIKSIRNLEVQNESGLIQPLKEVFNQKPTVVAFFYTRCMNPNKCTLTINKMGWLQKELAQIGLEDKINLLAFTYDPSHDTPTKMRVFGENRGMVLGPNAHLLRTHPEEFSILSDFFQLGVNHVASTVNQHRLELFLLNHSGNIKITYSRLQWDVEKVIRDLKGLLKRTSRFGWISSGINDIQQIVFPLLLVFFPKCPICWAIYLSAFGISGLQNIPYSPWLIPWIMLAIGVNLIVLYRKAKVRNGFVPFWISLVGGVLVLGPGYLFSNQFSSMMGVALIIIGALLNSLNYRLWLKFIDFFSPLFRSIKVFFRAMGKSQVYE